MIVETLSPAVPQAGVLMTTKDCRKGNPELFCKPSGVKKDWYSFAIIVQKVFFWTEGK